MKVYVVRLAKIEYYDAALRDQGYMDYISYMKKEGHEVLLEDMKFVKKIDMKDKIAEIANNSLKHDIPVVLSVMRSSQIKLALKLAKLLKSYGNICLIIGKLINYGSFSMPYFGDLINEDCIDYILPKNQPEMALKEYLDSNKRATSSKRDCCFLKVNTKEIFRIDLIKPSKKKINNKFFTYELSRGCINRCFYCSNSLGRQQYNSVSKAIKEIKFISKNNYLNSLIFVGPEINFDDNYLKEFISRLKESKLLLKWTSYAIPRGLSYSILKEMYDSGCRLLSLGVETASEKLLNTIGKNTNRKEMVQILKDCYKIGIRTQVHIILGFPYETQNDIELTKKFLIKNKDYISNVNISNMDAPKDSLLGKNPDKYGVILDKSEPGEFYSFWENYSTKNKKQHDVEVNVEKLSKYLSLNNINNFTTEISFDDSFREIYLNSLGLLD